MFSVSKYIMIQHVVGTMGWVMKEWFLGDSYTIGYKTNENMDRLLIMLLIFLNFKLVLGLKFEKGTFYKRLQTLK